MVNRACILLFALCIQFDPSLQQLQKLRKRLNYMQAMITSVTLKNIKTQFDISKLHDAIELLNNKTEGESSVHTCADVSPIDAAAIADLESEMKKAINQHDLTITAIAKAVSDEKKYTRQQMEALEIVAETIANQSIFEIRSDLMEMNSTLKEDVKEVKFDLMVTKEMNNKMKGDLQEVKSDVIEMNSTLKEEVHGVKSDLMVTKEINNKLKEEVQDVKSELMETKEMNSKLKEDVHEVKSDVIEMNNKLKKELEENKKEILELRQMIMEMQQTKTGYSSAVVTVPVDTSSATALPVSTHLPSTVVPVPAHLPTCPDGWLKFQDTCYLYVTNDRVSWDVAETRCAEQGGVLAEPDTEEKMRYVLKTFTGASGPTTWLGGTDRQSEGTWVWSSSKRNITFFLWKPGQPNSQGGDQDCLDIWYGRLNDNNCSKRWYYICEKKANLQ